MHNSIKNLNIIKEQINTKERDVNIIAVSKTFPMSDIEPLLNSDHMHFGENKVQEAMEKWTGIRKINKNIELSFTKEHTGLHIISFISSEKAFTIKLIL